MAKPRALARLVSLSALLLFSGCATTRRYQATESLPVRLVSPTPFLVRLRARADTAANFCQALRVTGTVTSMQGDTLEFARVWSDRRPRGASDCLEGRPGFLLRSSAPDLQGETTVVPSGGKRYYVGYVLLAGLLTLFALSGV